MNKPLLLLLMLLLLLLLSLLSLSLFNSRCCCKIFRNWFSFDSSRVLVYRYYSLLRNSIYNGNRTEWSPIQSVIIIVINKIGRHEVLLPINRNYKKVSDILDFSRLKVQEIPRSRVFLLAVKYKPF